MTQTDTPHPSSPSLFQGIYTLPDAARILQLPLPKLRRWVGAADGSSGADVGRKAPPYGVTPTDIRGSGRDKHIDFLTLIELFTIYQLRKMSVGFREIRAAHSELQGKFETHHPFALKGLLSDGQKIVKELDHEAYLILNDQGQRGFRAVLEDFFTQIDFAQASRLAERYYPLGKDASVVVDPRVSFGRPVVRDTAIATETLFSLYKGGETEEFIANEFEIEESEVCDAVRFETRQAA